MFSSIPKQQPALGAKLGAGMGIAAGPLGAIAGTIPGAIIGGVVGGVAEQTEAGRYSCVAYAAGCFEGCGV